MKPTTLPICVALVLAAAMLPAHAKAPVAAPPRLSCELSAPATVEAGAPIPLTITLGNTSGEPVRVLRYYTPLEELSAPTVLRVLRDGAEPIAWRGKRAKRGAPGVQSYTLIPPAGVATHTIDLRRYYQLQPGRYVIEWSGELSDLYAGPEQPARREQTFARLECSSAALVIR